MEDGEKDGGREGWRVYAPQTQGCETGEERRQRHSQGQQTSELCFAAYGVDGVRGQWGSDGCVRHRAGVCQLSKICVFLRDGNDIKVHV